MQKNDRIQRLKTAEMKNRWLKCPTQQTANEP